MNLAVVAIPLLVAAGVGSAGPSSAERGEQLYRVTWLQAAPGALLDVIAELTEQPGHGERFVFRHSQGDFWDLLLLTPIPSYAAHLAERPGDVARLDGVAWREDGFYRGPAPSALGPFRSAGLFHIEAFIALAGKRDGLIRQREMENEYLRALGQPTNAIFTRELGAAWDSFTIGAYDSWTHFAARDGISAEAEETAATSAGFESAGTIGAYLRTLIRSHHDTLATPVR